MSFSDRVRCWVLKALGETSANNKQEAQLRFLEESLELVQAVGLPRDYALRLLHLVYDRKEGDPVQEVGGVMVTLARLTWLYGYDVDLLAERELSRIDTPSMIEKVRIRAQEKFDQGVAVVPSR